MTDPLLLRGLSIDLAGSERALEFARPVVSQAGVDHFVRPASGAGEPHLVPLREQDRRFVRWLADDEREIELDEGLWIAGPKLLDDLRSLSAGKTLAKSVQRSWTSIATGTDASPSGFRYRTGTYREYLDLMQRQANALEVALHRALFRRDRGANSPVARAFRLYLAFSVVDSPSRAFNSVLYAQETEVERARTLAVRAAVRAGFAADEAEVDARVEALRARVKGERLFEALSTAALDLPAGNATRSAPARLQKGVYAPLGGATNFSVVTNRVKTLVKSEPLRFRTKRAPKATPTEIALKIIEAQGQKR